MGADYMDVLNKELSEETLFWIEVG